MGQSVKPKSIVEAIYACKRKIISNQAQILECIRSGNNELARELQLINAGLKRYCLKTYGVIID